MKKKQKKSISEQKAKTPTVPAKIVEFTTKPADTLIIPSYNPQIHDEENIDQIKRSIKELGYVDPIIAKTDGIIIGGVGRLMALRELWAEGWNAVPADRVPVIIVECDDKTAKKLTIALNKIQSATDYTLLASLIQSLTADGETIDDLTVTGYETFELEDLINYQTDIINHMLQEDIEFEARQRRQTANQPLIVSRKFDLPIDFAPLVDTVIAELFPKFGKGSKAIGLALVAMAVATQKLDPTILEQIVEEIKGAMADEARPD